jgi:GntR family transcriptional regulator of vanillate catabolism
MPDRSAVNPRRAQTLVAVREKILRAEFPSRKAIEEVELSRTLGASRPVIHWVLEKLSHEGLIEETAEGAYVPRLITQQDVADAIEARGALEGLAACLAARRVKRASQLAKARRINSELFAALGSFDGSEPPTAEQMTRFAELNLAFHKAFIALAESPMLDLSLQRVQSIAFASPAAVVVPADSALFRQAVEEHETILEAIQAGDAARAETLVRQHARFALRGVKSALTRPPLRPATRDGSAAPRAKKTGAEDSVHRSEASGPTSQLILDAAAALFREKGFNEATTREIAARLNIQQASLYYHISGKEDLLWRISKLTMESIETRVHEALRSRKNPRERLCTFIHAHLEGLFENPDRSLAAFGEFRSLSRLHGKEMADLRGSYSDLLDNELKAAAARCILRTDIPVPVVRLALLNYLNWTPRWYRVSGPLPVEALADIYERVFFGGIAVPGTAPFPLPDVRHLPRARNGPAHSGTLGKFVRTAAELFSKQGYASTSTRSISSLIGMEKATLYYHVKSKEDLLYLICKASVETVQADVNRAIDGITCPLGQISVLIRAHCLSLLRDQTQHATSLAEVRSLSPARLAEIVSMRKSYQAKIREIFEAGQQTGVFRADVEPQYMASLLRALLDRTVEWYQKGGSLTPAALAEHFSGIFLFGAQSASRG